MRPDHRKGVLSLRERAGGERGAHGAEGLRGGAERLVADHQFARKTGFVDAEIENRIIVAFRQRQKQAVAPHEAERDGRLSECQPLAPLESANGLDLSLAQVAGRQDLLLDRILGGLDGDDMINVLLIIRSHRHGLKLSMLVCRARQPRRARQTTLPCNCFPNRSRSLERRGAANRPTVEIAPLPAYAGRRPRREAPILALERRPPSMAPRNGAGAAYSRSIGKRTLRSAASASRARMSPSARPAAIPTGITMKGFGNAGATGGDALSRTVMSENVSLLFSFACSAVFSRASS